MPVNAITGRKRIIIKEENDSGRKPNNPTIKTVHTDDKIQVSKCDNETEKQRKKDRKKERKREREKERKR